MYLVDVCTYKPPEENRVTSSEIFEVWSAHKVYSEDDIQFQTKVLAKSGLSPHGTYLPHSILPSKCLDKPRIDINSSMAECKLTVLGAVQGLLSKTGLQPKDIDVLVTTCSIFCPTPSMASMVVNHFKMRSDIQSYHLGGMGCSNGVVGINLVRDLLKAHPNVNAIFVTTEVTTPAYYHGADRHRQVTNLLFRMGAAAVLLSNKASWGGRVKYTLQHAERVHVGQSDEAYTAIHYGPDNVGVNGIYLGKNVVAEASRALTKVMWKIGPKVLNLSQKLRYVKSVVAGKLGVTSVPPFTPDFTECIDHFLIHAGGAKVLDGLGEALQLKEQDLLPSRTVLYDYGNLSSSTTWYTLSCIESTRGVKRGDRVMQIGVGSGIKCGVNVWKATRDISDVHEAWAHRAPEHAPAVTTHVTAAVRLSSDSSSSSSSKAGQQQKEQPWTDLTALGRAQRASRMLLLLLLLLVGCVLSCMGAVPALSSDGAGVAGDSDSGSSGGWARGYWWGTGVTGVAATNVEG